VQYSQKFFTMNVLSLSLLATAASASVLPLKLNFGSLNPSLRGVKQCEGHEDDIFVVVDGTSPDEICMPSIMTVDTNTIIREDLPTDLILDMKIQKLTPFVMTVPCLNGIGSCEYELCPMIENDPDTWCSNFPDWQPCGCPLLAGELNLNGMEVPVQDMGDILGPLMEGEYSATANFFGASNKDKILGCVEFTFALKNC